MRELPTGTVTLLFTDIEGSTRLLQRVGEHYSGLLEACRSLLHAAFLQFGGHEVDTQGDACFVAFARANDAVAAAVAGQSAIFTHAWPDGVTVRVRMGLHTGEPQRSAESYVGLDVHYAARIMSAGHGGQVLLSQTTRDLVAYGLPEGVSLLDLGWHRLKDLQQPGQLFQLAIAGLPADFPSLKTLDSSPHNLPIQPTPFIGREKEVDAVQQLLLRQEVHLVTLTGPGGVGKTRLALQVAAEIAEHFPDGMWFVSLAPISDPNLVIPAIIQTLGLREAREQSQMDHLKGALHEKKTMLLLDNFEQVVSAANQIADLLAVCPQLSVLITSREGLHVRAEREFPVPALALPDAKQLPDPAVLSQYEAVALFIERAQAVQPDFAITGENAAAIVGICHRVDGLPLAIELAAGRSKLFAPQALLPRLENRLKVLIGGARDLPSRQQTLRGTIAWSYDLLDRAEKRLFRRLSVFVGGCTLEAAEAVSNANQDLGIDVLHGVTSLVDKSLLRQETQADGDPRLLMLETIREYALERLAASGEAETFRRRHATFFLRLSEEAEPKIRSAERSTWRKRLEVEHDNLRAALRWTLENQEAEMGLSLAGALLAFWRVSNQDHEGRSWCEQVLAQPGAKARTTARAKALLAAGVMTRYLGDLQEAQRLLEESVSIGQEGGTAGKRSLAHALTGLSHVALLQGNLGAARELGEESMRLFREVGEAWGTALALNFLGRATLEMGDLVAARVLLEESAALFRIIGDRQRLALPLNALGLVALRQGDYVSARAHYEEALAVSQETGDEQYIAEALAYLGTVVLRVGDYQQSLALYLQSLALNRVRGYKDGIAEDLAGVAEVANLTGQPERAAWLLGAVEALREVSGIRLSPLRQAEYDCTVGGIRAQLDEAAFAAAWAEGRSMTLEQVLAALIASDSESALGKHNWEDRAGRRYTCG